MNTESKKVAAASYDADVDGDVGFTNAQMQALEDTEDVSMVNGMGGCLIVNCAVRWVCFS